MSAKLLEVYHRTGVRVIGHGQAGPTTPLALPPDLAKQYLEADPDLWSKKPFDGKGEKPPVEKTE